jgi:hypothetical protein
MIHNIDYLREAAAANAHDQKIQRLKEQLAEAEADKREAEKRAKAIATSDTAVGMVLSAPLRQVGLTADAADALDYLLSMPIGRFGSLIQAAVEAEPETSVASFIRDTIQTKHAELSEAGRKLALTREWLAYKQDCESFAAWQRDNPDKVSWRTKPASRAQYFLMWRTAQYLGIDPLVRCKRGEAHDWLMLHGANLRLKAVELAIQQIEEGLNG